MRNVTSLRSSVHPPDMETMAIFAPGMLFGSVPGGRMQETSLRNFDETSCKDSRWE